MQELESEKELYVPKAISDEFYTVRQVATDLRVSTRTVRRWIENGSLTAHKFGRSVRIAARDLRAFLNARRR
jgi:excisionase family DNA binding protein